ncbi:HlyC/CorC family transporter [Agreia pratensis]|uniref:Hemolysin, contains CBS domains n=1 Tax=Agreia pratensis TaxID=150121 RepID=A0A1X7L062_9MICO|nr:hemolysin family protein [Agreia pratensis]MBF4633778.1 HlyC/CorC family transporter [Agreia pratensis]SMG46682.1 Hemolysin, contains CBS domains [Agreia pratensis]
MITALFLIAAFLLVALGGLFAATDSALVVLSRGDIAELAEKYRAKRSLRAIATDPSPHMNAVNFARVVSETTAAVLVTIVLSVWIEGPWLVLLFAALIMTTVSFVLVGSSPRSVGRAHPEAVIGLTAFLVHALRVVLGPIAGALVSFGNRVTPGRPRSAAFTSEQQLLSMVDEATELDVLEEEDRELIHSIIDFSDTVVREVMIPRTDMVTVDVTATVGQGMGLFLSTGVSRMPVVADDVDEIVGILYLRDVARLSYEKPNKVDKTAVGKLARPALFVPESKKVDDTLRQMQLDSNHLAMVVDEYGGIAGLVTLEDLIEELVGDISDEYDREIVEVETVSPGVYRVSARLPVDELGELFDLELDDDDVDSVGGLLSKELGRLPSSGSRVSANGLVLTAERTEGRRKRISTVLVQRDTSATPTVSERGSE